VQCLVFGVLIDSLPDAGEFVGEAGLVLGLVAGLAGLGGAYGAGLGGRAIPHRALLAGGLGWAGVALVLLPLAGDGVGGCAEGLTAPLVWALLFAIYAFLLELCFKGLGSAGPDPGRRRALRLIPLGVAAVGLAILSYRLVPGWVQAVTAAPEDQLGGPSPELTPVQNFYLVSKNFSDPVVAERGWSLNVRGLAARPRRFSLADLHAFEQRAETVTLSCVSNNVGGSLISTGRFAGVSLADLVAAVEPLPSGAALTFHARDGYTESIPLSLVRGAPEILLATELDGAPLADRHGFPARILIPGHYGMKGPKWLDEIELTAAETNGYWESQGWDRQAIVKTTARIDSPRADSLLRRGTISVAGVAFAGTRGVSAVEWSPDGGRSWTRADLRPPLSELTWVLWTASWSPAVEGAYTLAVRALDGAGRLQTAEVAPSYPSGASGYHRVQVTIAR